MDDPDSMVLRDFRPADAPEVAALVARTIRAAYAGVYSGQALGYFRDFHTVERICADALEGHTVVLESDGRMVGTGTLTGGEIRRVYVEPARQGEGLGRRIVSRLLAHAAAEGIGSLSLCSSLVSKHFWQSMGFRVDREASEEFPDGERLDYYDMVMRLGG